MSSFQSRRPAGTPAGGQFAGVERSEAASTLTDERPTPDLGDVSNVTEGSRTPWGAAQWVAHTAPGAVQVSTAGHGGIKLSPERNRTIPAALRNRSGWYEEDCEAGIVAWFHPDTTPRPGATLEEISQHGRDTVRNWFPDGYEQATGETIPVGYSHVKDERCWYETHSDDEIAVSASSGDGVPDGMVAVTVRRGGHSRAGEPERVLLVPRSDYNSPAYRHPLGQAAGSFVVPSGAAYQDVTPPPAAPAPPRARYRGINTAKLTDLQRVRAESDLQKRWRMPGGETPTTRQLIESGRVSGKSATTSGEGGRRSYYLRCPQEAEGEPGSGSVYALEVSKALWDAVEAPSN